MQMNESLIDLVTWTPQWDQKLKYFCDTQQRFWAINYQNIQNEKDQALFQSILLAFGLSDTNYSGECVFGLNFSSNKSEHFKVSNTHQVHQMLTVPHIHEFRANGVLKKTLWHYAKNLGMIQLSTF